MTEKTVVVKNLVKKFGDFTAVNDISFEVGRGEIFGFLGPNGAGKSTTIKILCGILKPSSGEGRVLGHSMMENNIMIRRSIGYMSQKFSLYNDLTVEENLEFYGSLYGLKGGALREIIRSRLSDEGLSDYARSMVGALPGGIKQKLALCSSTLHDPGVLFLDEPTSGVDPKSRRKFWELIYAFAARGKTVFVTTHYMDEAEHCSRIAMIIAGRMIALDSPRNLKESLEFDILRIKTADTVAALDVIVSQGGLDASIFGSDIHVVVPDAKKSAKIISKALGAKFDFSIEKIPPSLEDLFVVRARPRR